jgi:ADP-ribose pyrophosphatase
MEKLISSERIFDGRVIGVRRDVVELPDGTRTTRELIEHNGGVGVLAITDDGHILMVRQYRYGIGRESLEIPAGKLEKGESPRLCGIRELEEETGHIAGEFLDFGSMDPTPAYDSEVISLFLARKLTPTAQRLDPGELLSVERVPFDEALALCLNGGITDAKTQIAILKYKAVYGV